MFATLNVYLKNRFCGQVTWESERNSFSFRYVSEYLDDPSAERLSFALPLQKEPFDEEVSYRYFANLLPPETVRRKLEKCLHVSKNNIFGFLKEIGGDCAGAVALYSPGVRMNLGGDENLEELDDGRAVEILKSLKRRPLFAKGKNGYRYSAAGAQDKLVARIKDGKLILPLDGTPSTHIVKPGTDDFAHSVENECFCEALASECGIRAAKPSIAIFGGERYYVSERFDREFIDGKVLRLHQEDFCQMLSVDPEVKYESDGGPNFTDLIETMRRLHAPLGETLALIDMFLFNFLIGNCDAHAKNYSVVYRDRKPYLSPLYDAVSTLVYKELSRDFAMSIGGEMAIDKIERGHFERLAKDSGMSPKLVLSHLDALIERLPTAAEKLMDRFMSTYPSPIYEQIIRVIELRIAKVKDK